MDDSPRGHRMIGAADSLFFFSSSLALRGHCVSFSTRRRYFQTGGPLRSIEQCVRAEPALGRRPLVAVNGALYGHQLRFTRLETELESRFVEVGLVWVRSGPVKSS